MADWINEVNFALASASVQHILIWSAGSSTRAFLGQLPPAVRSKSIQVVDQNPKLAGQSIQTIPIHSPSSIDFSLIDVVVIPSAVFHNEIREQLAAFPAFRGKIIDFFDEQVQSYRLVEWADKNISFIRENNISPFLFTSQDAFLVAPNGLQLCLSRQDEHSNQLIYHMVHNLYYEKAETELMLSSLCEGGVLIDIGANVGWYSIAAARHFAKISVHSFEPGPSTFELLKKNVEQNGAQKKVHLNRLALGEKIGTVRFTSDLDTGNHIAAASDARAVEVECTTLDAYCAKAGLVRVDFIKCDVEGAELLVLRGAKDTLTRFRPKLLLEVVDSWCRRFGYTPADLFDFMQNRGYAIYGMDEQGALSPLSGAASFLGRNFLFMHRDDPHPVP